MTDARFAVFRTDTKRTAPASHTFIDAVPDVGQLGSHLTDGTTHDVLDILLLRHFLIKNVNGSLVSIELSAIGTNPFAFVGKRAA